MPSWSRLGKQHEETPERGQGLWARNTGAGLGMVLPPPNPSPGTGPGRLFTGLPGEGLPCKSEVLRPCSLEVSSSALSVPIGTTPYVFQTGGL